MTIGQTAISAALTSAYNDDKPCFLGENIIENEATAPVWRSYNGAVFNYAIPGDTAVTDSAKPAERAYDRLATALTSPTSQTTKGYAIMFDLTTSWTADLVVILEHNFPDVQAGGTLTARIWVSDDNFTNVVTGDNNWIWTIGDNKRLVGFAANSYSGIEQVQLSLTNTVDFSGTPRVGEILIGRRRQVSRQPNEPWGREVWDADVVRFASDDGDMVHYERYKGRRLFAPTWSPTGTDTYGLDDVTTLQDLAIDIGYGSQPFIFWPRPKTKEDEGFFCYMEEPYWPFEFQGPFEQEVALDFKEMRPFRSSEI